MNASQIRERIRSIWRALDARERWDLFKDLPEDVADEVFLDLDNVDQAEILGLEDSARRRSLLLSLPPDDTVDLLQVLSADEQEAVVAMLEQASRVEVESLRSYPADEAGGLMTPRFTTLRPQQSVVDALSTVRDQARSSVETVSMLYVTDHERRLLGVMSLRQLLAASDSETVETLMETDFLHARLTDSREVLGRLFSDNGLSSLAVVDSLGVLKGIVTFDDVTDAVEDEVTEDIQRMGGSEVLDGPYLRVPLGTLIRKRAGWLAALFVGEMLTATAMGHYEDEIAKAVILAVFVPLIISSGGNSGSQASTLIIRAMALDEVRLSDWPKVARREVISGLCLGTILGLIGFLRILLWQNLFGTYGTHAMVLAVTVGLSLIGVVLFGTFSGSMLPFLLRRLGFDPASASAPFVATLVDVTGLVIYFTVASITLKGIIL